MLPQVAALFHRLALIADEVSSHHVPQVLGKRSWKDVDLTKSQRLEIQVSMGGLDAFPGWLLSLMSNYI